MSVVITEVVCTDLEGGDAMGGAAGKQGNRDCCYRDDGCELLKSHCEVFLIVTKVNKYYLY